MAAVVIAAMGLLIYSYASLQERLYRFAVLHAVGLTRRQIVAQAILEYAFLTVCGAATGTLIGVVAARLFVPFFRVTGEGGIPLPPLVPLVARQDIDRLTVTFVSVMVLMGVVVLTRALSRHRFDVLRGHWG